MDGVQSRHELHELGGSGGNLAGLMAALHPSIRYGLKSRKSDLLYRKCEVIF